MADHTPRPEREEIMNRWMDGWMDGWMNGWSDLLFP